MMRKRLRISGKLHLFTSNVYWQEASRLKWKKTKKWRCVVPFGEGDTHFPDYFQKCWQAYVPEIVLYGMRRQVKAFDRIMREEHAACLVHKGGNVYGMKFRTEGDLMIFRMRWTEG